MAIAQLVSSLERAYAYLITEPTDVPTPCRTGYDTISTEDLERFARFVGAEDVARVVDQVYAGRTARELTRKTEVREESLETFCNTIFYTYLPKEKRTESLQEVFLSEIFRFGPRNKNCYI